MQRAAEKRNELTSPHIRTKLRDSIVSAQTSTLIGAETGTKTIAQGTANVADMGGGQAKGA